MKDGYSIGSILVAKEGYGMGKESWDGKLIPTEQNALSDYLKGISL